MLHYIDRGQGKVLVLLHGIGMSSNAWKPVIPLLSQSRRVLAFDAAGFGRSPALPCSTPPTTENLVKALRASLNELGIHEPVDIAGNSMGGWMALEAARQGFASSVVAISPAGLWLTPPLRAKHTFFGIRRIARAFPGLVSAALRQAWLREVLMAMPLTTGCRRMPAEAAIEATFDFVNAVGFDRTFAHATRFEGGQSVQVPVTVAFGTHDWLLPERARLRGELPVQTRWIEPQGWGHVPMWKDPEGVAELILMGSDGQV